MKPVQPSSRIAAATLAGLALGLCGGCTSLGGDSAARADLPHLSPGRNQIIAWVPQAQAQTASVAQALAHITLAQAKKATESELCGGTWIFSGRLHQDRSPQLSTAPAHLGGISGWQVRISWDPQLDECGVSAQSYALNLSRHLPAWMMAQSGQPLALYHQGQTIYHQDSAPHYALALNGDTQ